MQETLVSRPEGINSLRAKWAGSSFLSPASGKQGGVAILVSENSPFEILQWRRDSSGRIVSVLTALGEHKFNFVNIYAPTNVTDRKGFYDTLHEYTLEVIIIALKVNLISSGGI